MGKMMNSRQAQLYNKSKYYKFTVKKGKILWIIMYVFKNKWCSNANNLGSFGLTK